MFTPEQLEEKRRKVYQEARSVFSVSLSFEEEMKYISYYCNKLIDAGIKIGFNRFERYTALAIMQRVYLTRSIWEIPPPLAMIMSLFIVSKFNHDVMIDSFIVKLGFGSNFEEKYKVQRQMPQIEIQVLEAIDFKLKIHLPFHQVTAICDGKPYADKQEECQQFLFELLQTDALFLYTPGQLAVAAVAKIVGHDQALEAVKDIPVPEDAPDLATIIDEIIWLEPIQVTEEEIQHYEEVLGPEYGLFHIISEEKKKKKNLTNPTTLTP
ncbi:hypothetical protein GPJ56_001726 [Histomonas meleagridis]|uniref:uncharacterized protein n=1 Tax=Histomonas meleagridis TaxID=135588 RepID=UPI0035594987|nr:hypothetical protein GPJ56_001726 [Histomonas meleagridis]KAH0796189.1 hypothetical protein GO595_010082 [Histomonas meleagridis]